MYFIIFCICFFFTALFFSYSHYVHEKYRELKLAETATKIKSEIEQLNMIIADMESSAQDISFVANRLHSNKQSSPIRHIEELAPYYLSSARALTNMTNSFGIWFEPYAFDEQTQNIAFLARKDKNTGEITCTYYDKQNLYPYHEELWYKQILPDDTPRKLSEHAVSWGPQIINLEEEAEIVATVYAHIYNKEDAIIGFATIDCRLSTLFRPFTKLEVCEEGQFLLADKERNKAFSFTPSDNLYKKGPLSKISWLEGTAVDGEAIKIFHKIIEEEPHYIFTALTKNNLLFAYLVPEKELLFPIEEKSTFIFMFMGIFVAATIFSTTYFVDNMVNKPVSQLNAATEKISSGFISEINITKNSCEELSTLMNSFNKVIQSNNDTLKGLINSIPYMIYIVDTNSFKIRLANKRLKKIFPNLKEGDLCYKVIFEKNIPCNFCPIQNIKRGFHKNSKRIDIYNAVKNLYFRIQAGILDWNGSKKHALVSITDITKDNEEKERLEILAETDELTNLLNRRGGVMALRKIVADKKGSCIAVILIDINGLKYVNDVYGHNEGDVYIKLTVAAIRQNIRANDILSRMGGDEFMIILPNYKKDVTEMFERMNYEVKELLQKEGKPYTGSFSFGADSFVSKGTVEVKKLLEKIDKKMYENKKDHYKNMAQQRPD